MDPPIGVCAVDSCGGLWKRRDKMPGIVSRSVFAPKFVGLPSDRVRAGGHDSPTYQMDDAPTRLWTDQGSAATGRSGGLPDGPAPPTRPAIQPDLARHLPVLKTC